MTRRCREGEEQSTDLAARAVFRRARHEEPNLSPELAHEVPPSRERPISSSSSAPAGPRGCAHCLLLKLRRARFGAGGWILETLKGLFFDGGPDRLGWKAWTRRERARAGVLFGLANVRRIDLVKVEAILHSTGKLCPNHVEGATVSGPTSDGRTLEAPRARPLIQV
ncbi:hypothetical protein VUR80DRAFT_9663 [Thermomyces stellatus]